MSKHTPGPWDYYQQLSGSENHRGYMVRRPKHWNIAEVYPLDEDGAEGEANAKLIAASPDLLAALRKLKRAAVLYCVDSPIRTPKYFADALDAAESAMAKVK